MNMVPQAARIGAGAAAVLGRQTPLRRWSKPPRPCTATLSQGRAVDACALRAAMEDAFRRLGQHRRIGVWKDAYDACEAAQVLFLRRYGSAIRRPGPPATPCWPCSPGWRRSLPTQTRPLEESQALQQFSTPASAWALWVSVAAELTPADVVLEPSAGTGLLAIFAELAGCDAWC